ncbi:MAG TPA: HAMP domain-containing sensor histidine kinase, partial [Ktedonobacterales bacterium]|nr:HAMP domain-containing sensor histidine kinase [Ktedonobacterales bacterium]
ALLTWIAAQSVTANALAARRALAREHELMLLKDQFIIDANHELRTPIMALYGNIEVLGALGARATPEQHSRLLTRAKTAGEQVLRQLNSILDAGGAEATATALTLAPVTLRPLIHDVLTTFDPREIGEPDLAVDADQARAVTLDVAPDLVVLADAGRVRQVLLNLVSNALKYSASGTPITVSAGVEVDEPNGWQQRTPASAAQLVRISVCDQGLGVPPGEAHRLFQRFVRLERDIAGPVRGTGVGLYLCRMFVEAMGGTITVTSSGIPDEGSTFSFTLPYVADQQRSPIRGIAD